MSADLPLNPGLLAPKLQMLREFSSKLQGLIQSENFFQDAVDIIQRHFQYHAIQIWLVNGQGAEQAEPRPTMAAQAGAYLPHLKIGHALSARDGGIITHVVRTRELYLCNDVAGDPNFTSLSLPVGSKSEICVPILRDGQVIGTLNVESNQTQAFDEFDAMMLQAMASQISIAMANRDAYLRVKDFNLKLQTAVDEKTVELRLAHERILEQQRLLQRENKALKTLVDQTSPGEIVGQSPAILNIMAMVDKIAPTSATVLILGESGTGKELIARRLHQKSDRTDRPFVTVNCGALQETLLESELFGHEKGSFTGAVQQKMGLVETADGGTLFLDEVGELSPAIQAKLLRFLQEGEFYRVGGKRPLKVNVRVVSATNRDLEIEVKAGRFREDLFYRLNTISLRMPPLRKRKEDIPALIDYFTHRPRFAGGAKIKKIDPRIMDLFQNYDWPGNIRELQNTIERLSILAENGEIRIEDIPFNIRMPKARLESAESQISLPLEEVEKNHILRVLAYHQGNKTKTAHALGVTIKTLYNKLHRYGVITAQSGAAQQDEV